ncbi:MAG: hypothetical protein ACFFCM_01510 [Promethearchaeota archaeon]
MYKARTQEEIELIKEVTEEVSQLFLDTINIRQILIFHRVTGTTLVSKSFIEQETDPDLISGFITAISAFEKELVGIAGGLEELKYKFIRFMLDIRELTTVVLLMNGDYAPSLKLRKNLSDFHERFELEFQSDLEKFDGYVKPVRNIEHLLEDHFEISLFNPHRLLPKKFYNNMIKIIAIPKENLNKIRKMEKDQVESTINNIIKG